MKYADLNDGYVFQMLMGDTLSTAPPVGVYVTGLQLHNASWDSTRCVLKETAPDMMHKPYNMPTVWLKPVDMTMSANKIKGLVYECPVYVDSSSPCVAFNNMVTQLALPTIVKPSIWTQRRVCLSCAPVKEF